LINFKFENPIQVNKFRTGVEIKHDQRASKRYNNIIIKIKIKKRLIYNDN